MRFPRRSIGLALCVSVTLSAVSCGSDDEPSTSTVADTLAPIATTTTTSPPSTTVVETTTTAVPTTVAPTTTVAVTTTTPAPTTTAAPTTVPVGASISLDEDGIGDATFGEDPDDVVSYLNDIIGEPSEDSGWVDAISRTCPGTEVRFVRWSDLTLVFGDDSSVDSGRRHFFAWSFGPPVDVGAAPAGLATAAGVSVGSTVADVGRAYPTASLFDGDEMATASIHINDNLFAFVTSIEDSGVVTAMLGGQGCGE